MIGAEIRGGAFDYLKWFPHGNRAAEFLIAGGMPVPETARAAGPELDRAPLLRRVDRAEDFTPGAGVGRSGLPQPFPQLHPRCVGRRDARGIVARASRGFADHLRKRGLSEKTIRNAIDGLFRAMVRDAGEDDIPAGFPFPKVRWPEKIVPGPSPFTADERDQILDYFKVKRWKCGGFNDTRLHYPYFAFLYTLFFTGMRPSEAVAVRIRSVNFGARTVQVERSRHLGAEAAPKTARARRAVRLTRERGSAGAADRAQGPAGRLSVQERLGHADRGREFLRPVPRRAEGAVDFAAAGSLFSQGHVHFAGADGRGKSDVAVGTDGRRRGDDAEALWPFH